MVAKIRIYARPQSIKEARWPDFYKYTRLPVTRWVKLRLNLTKIRNKIGGTKVWPNFFYVKMTQFFSLSAPSEKMSHVDLKSWVTDGANIWPNFLGQNESIFLSVRWGKQLSHFDLKVESLAEQKFWPNCLGQND